jgi:ABC-type transport system involved in multi-copper enzyme maturation permease subunit
MNRTIARALLEDAFRQVMDNKVFRLLLLLCIVLVAPWYLMGFREDGIHLLYGWKTIAYSDFLGSFGRTSQAASDTQIQFIQSLQSLFVEWFAGLFGFLFCIAATAFFVPRMLEKGAADTLFTKPIHRFALLAARYTAGILFVGILSLVLVVGIHVGLLIFSGYSDPAFLWSALTLVYVYAIVQTVSVIVGVFTRSSVAAILCTTIFLAFNGCVQKSWVVGQWAHEREHARFADAPDAANAAAAEKNPILVFLADTLSVLHYTLPKTHDADVLTKKLRTIVAGKGSVVRDDAIHLVVGDDPEGFRLATDRGSVDLSKAPARWVGGWAGESSASITLSRRSRANEAGSSTRRARQSTSQAATELVKTLEGTTSIVPGSLTRESPDSMQLLSEIVRWNETAPAGIVGRQHAFIGVDDWMVEIDVREPGADAQSIRDRVEVLRFMRSLRVEKDDVSFLSQDEWYEKRFGWTAPLPFNAFFSLLSSIAFAALMLGISAWRLSRIDF